MARQGQARRNVARSRTAWNGEVRFGEAVQGEAPRARCETLVRLQGRGLAWGKVW